MQQDFDVDAKKFTVLCVDDNSFTLRIVEHCLSEAGFQVVLATSGAEALNKVRRMGWPDLATIDIHMPGGMSGLDLMLTMKGTKPKLPMLALTAVAESGFVVEAIEAGFSDYIVKPFDPPELVARVRRLLAEPTGPSVSNLYSLISKLRTRNESLNNEVRQLEQLVDEHQLDLSDKLQFKHIGESQDFFHLFLNGLIHELSNSVVPILEIVRLAQQSQEPKKHLERVESLIERTIDILQRLRAPLLSLQSQEIDLQELVEITKELIMIPPQVRLTVNIPDEARTVRANAEALSQVFVNLITNALQAISGEGLITIQSKLSEDHQVEVRIIDSGRGMTDEVQAKLFEPFFTTKKQDGGQGIGLWISRQFIEKFGGTLILEESISNEGSTFLLRLPAANNKQESKERGDAA